MKKIISVFVFLFILSIQCLAETIVKTTSVQEIKNLMQTVGYTVEINKDGDISWKIDGTKTILYIIFEGQGLSFFVAYNTTKVSLGDINDFNKNYLYSRSFLNDKGNPCLKSDLSLDGGITNQRLLSYFHNCKRLLSLFEKKIFKL